MNTVFHIIFNFTASKIFSIRFNSSFISKEGVPNIKLFIKKGKIAKLEKNKISSLIFFKFNFLFLILKIHKDKKTIKL